MSDYAISVEPWSDAWWAQAKPLACSHFAEVDGGVEPNRPFDLDCGLMEALDAAGCLKLVTARLGSQMVGYYTWNISLDVESRGLLIAQQGAWYVAPGHPRAAVELFDFAVEALLKCGVKCIFPHHRVQGRGAHIGRFFKRRGAKKTQDTYSLWIGG